MIRILCLILFLQVRVCIKFYEVKTTNHTEEESYDCFLYDVVFNNVVKVVAIKEQISFKQQIPYCLRSPFIFKLIQNEFSTFLDLKEQGITSEELFHWSSSIDLVEDYQIYLNGINDSLSQKTFFNCSDFRFGLYCQYSFLVDDDYSFSNIVQSTLDNMKLYIGLMEIKIRTCYTHLICNRGPYPSCLDWREICNGKVDCLDNDLDERNCFQLELTQCSENEFRCHNGFHCIPSLFVQDNYSLPDCIDASDEIVISDRLYVGASCHSDPSFACEEQTCRTGETNDFVCGNGQCLEENGLCSTGRGNMMVFAMNAPDNNTISRYCKTLMMHLTWRYSFSQVCLTISSCTTLLRTFCNSTLFFFPSYPILYGHVRFIFSRDSLPVGIQIFPGLYFSSIVLYPTYICYSKKLCNEIYHGMLDFDEDLSCEKFDRIFGRENNMTWSNMIKQLKKIFHKCLTIHDQGNLTHCSHSSFYHCRNSSKCISKYRVKDGIEDCYESDDEETTNPLTIPTNLRFDRSANRTLQLYPRLCDGYLEMHHIQYENQTDETDCQWWPCMNIYTRCNHIWNCPNGEDEFNCSEWSRCSPNEFPCVSPVTYNLTCVSSEKYANGIVDCVGGTDERNICQPHYSQYPHFKFQCWNSSICIAFGTDSLCDGVKNCPFEDDELICDTKRSSFFFCDYINAVTKYLCDTIMSNKFPRYFKIQNSMNYFLEDKSSNQSNRETFRKKIDRTLWNCNRGIPIAIYQNQSKYDSGCLCPPAYYGSQCQYQNDRVSLSIRITAEAERKTLFILITKLIDKNFRVHSFNQFEYLVNRDCYMKYQLYHLYYPRMKNFSENYSIRIHVYEKQTFTYRATWLFPIQYSFLPVHRLSLQITVPLNLPKKCSFNCNYGQCIYYQNQNDYFCLCDKHWSGSQCNIPSKCQCANDSLCLYDGVTEICLCPLHKYGSRCYLSNHICRSNPCLNSGQCLSRFDLSNFHQFSCICSDGYSGDRCEKNNTKIHISFENLDIPTSILLHFIRIDPVDWPIRLTRFEKISLNQTSLSFYYSDFVHLILGEIDQHYYFLFSEERTIQYPYLNLSFSSSKQCSHIKLFFNTIFFDALNFIH